MAQATISTASAIDTLTQQGPLSLGYPSVYSFEARGREYTIARRTGWSFGEVSGRRGVEEVRLPVFSKAGGERFVTFRDSEPLEVTAWLGGTWTEPVIIPA